MDIEPTDADLARWIAAREPGAERAEAALVRRFAPRIELYGIRHLGSRAAAADLVQQVLLRVLEALRAGRLKSAERLASFVLGTCRLVTWGSWREEQRRRQLAHAVVAEEPVAEEPALLGEGDVVRLFGCMSSLPEREARVVRMSFWEDRPADEIGARLGLSAGNVRVIRHRAVARLATCMNVAGAA